MKRVAERILDYLAERRHGVVVTDPAGSPRVEPAREAAYYLAGDLIFRPLPTYPTLSEIDALGYLTPAEAALLYAPLDPQYLVVALTSGLPNERALLEGDGIDFVDGGAGSTFEIKTKQRRSIEIGSAQLQLVNDEDTPGASEYYGTDEDGDKGWFPLPNPAAAGVVVKTTGTGATYTVPAGVRSIRVRLVGGGGGGGGAAGTTSGIGTGGSAGGYVEKSYNVLPGDAFLYTVSSSTAAGGTGNASGTTGSTTTFDNSAAHGATLSGGGGGGGASTATGSGFAAIAPAGGGAASGGDVNVSGASGQSAARNATSSFSLSSGAGSAFGSGGNSGANSTGGAAVGFGAGGGGTCSTSGQASQTGGTGAPGVIIIEEYP